MTADLHLEQSDTRQQWRFFFKSASDNMVGCQWRDTAPTTAELAEWREDIPGCWIETRQVSESAPRRVEDWDLPLA